MVSKEKILKQLIDIAKSDLNAAKSAFQQSREHATGDDMKAEGKYDTRSIEAGYIAGAQQVRLTELEQEIKLLEEVNLDHNNENISVGSLVNVLHAGKKRLYFISSTSGGHMIKVGEDVVLVISAFSPLGVELIGLSSGDDFEIETASETRSYEVSDIW